MSLSHQNVILFPKNTLNSYQINLILFSSTENTIEELQQALSVMRFSNRDLIA